MHTRGRVCHINLWRILAYTARRLLGKRMPAKKSSGGTTKKKAAVKSPRKRAPRKRAAAPATATTAPAPAADRLSEVARTIGSKVGGIVAKTKKVLRRAE